MRRVAALSVIVAVVALAGCTAVDAPRPTTSAPPEAVGTPSPATSPSASVLAVGAGEAPPIVFDGDCAAILSDGDVAAAVGRSLVLESEGEASGTIRNVGGVQCSWADWDAGVHLVVSVLPLAGLDDVDPTTVDAPWTAPDCSWYCSRVDIVSDVVVATSMNQVPAGAGSEAERLRPVAERIVTAVAPRAATRDDPPWTRDRSGWSTPPECASMSASLSAELGFAVQATDWSIYIDYPLMGGIIADDASRLWACRFVSPSGAETEAWGTAGMAWEVVPAASRDGWPAGWSAVQSSDRGTLGMASGDGFILTDGVNEIHVPPTPDGFGADARQLSLALIASL